MFLCQEGSCANNTVCRWIFDEIKMPFVNHHVHKKHSDSYSVQLKVFVSYNRCSTMQHFYHFSDPRSHGKRTGRWCIHTRANAGGLELLEMMERVDR